VVALTIATALGSALVSGVFFAFSTFVMPALAARPTAEAIANIFACGRVSSKQIDGEITRAFSVFLLDTARIDHRGRLPQGRD
jgi:uncharacterized membrane protein